MIKRLVNLTGDFDIDREILFDVFVEQAGLLQWLEREGCLHYADRMLRGNLEDAVQYFNGWFGEEVDLILPERRIEEERLLREAQDDIDKADWT